MRYLKKIILILMLLVLASCSPDPRVAPFKAWIVGVDANTVLFDEDYGTRVLILKPGEDATVTIAHNRCSENNGKPVHKVTIGTPESNETYVATVTDAINGVFNIRAVDEGCSRVSIRIEGEKVQWLKGSNKVDAYVFVIVESDDSSNGIQVKLSKVNGDIVAGELSNAVLQLNDTMTFTYQDNSSIIVDHVDWYVNGVKKGTGDTFDYQALVPGQHNVRCIVYGFKNGDWDLGHSNEFQVKVNP